MPSRTSELTPLDFTIAVLATAAILLHDWVHVSEGRYWDTLWVCNVAALLVGPSILLRSSLLAAASLTWLVPGTLVWLADSVLAGSNILPTSYAVHLGGTAAALYATRRSGFAERGWLAALGVLGLAVALSALMPASTNVNAAHGVPRGWSFLGGSRWAFTVAALGLVLAACGLGRVLARRVTAASDP